MSDMPILPKDGSPEFVVPTPEKLGEESRLNRFFQQVTLLFKREVTPDVQLMGRIRELQSDCSQVLNDLLLVKEQLNQIDDPEVGSLVSGLVDPIINEFGRIEEQLGHGDQLPQQVKAINRCGELQHKAKVWIDLSKGVCNRDTMVQAVIRYSTQEFQARIDRDMQIIQDYLHNSLDGFGIIEETKEVLLASLEPDLKVHIEKLNGLKEIPKSSSLGSFLSWRSDVNSLREHHYNEAFHMIDKLINEFKPVKSNEQVSNHAMAILIKLAEIEEGITELSKQVTDFHSLDDKLQKRILSSIHKFETIANNLNENLLLPAEDSERVQQALDDLQNIRDRIVS